MDQIGIALFGVTAIFLAQQSQLRWRRWACIFGMLGQPFWVYASWGKWGMFFVVCLYTFSWGLGIWTNWIRPWREAHWLAR